jgi:hypothetical protein
MIAELGSGGYIFDCQSTARWVPFSISKTGQRIFVVNIRDYAYPVPFVETEREIFLRTVVPSRKATRDYLKGDKDGQG